MTDTASGAGPRAGRHIQAIAGDTPSPSASRLATTRWLNTRLVVGVLLVLVSVMAGARLLATADDTVPVLVAADDLVPGQPLTSDMVEPSGALLEGGLDQYVTGEVGSGYLIVRPVDRGELLPRSAIVPASEVEDVRQVTVPVPASEAPAGLSAGDTVDVWLVPEDGDGSASLLLRAARVTAAASGGSGLGAATGQHRVTLAVAVDDLEKVTAALVAGARAGQVYLTRLPEAVP